MQHLKLHPEAKQALDGALSAHGLRSTRQRDHVFAVLLAKRDHPTAEEVFERSQQGMPSISLATVYNCLENLVASGLVKQVNIEREPSRYCPNLAEHAHFHCRQTGRVYDIALPPSVVFHLKEILPEIFTADSIEIAFHGKSLQSTA
jgi:Fur family peroxide stress response transcriptional regulator